MVGGLTDRSWLEVAQSEREQLLAELESIELLEQMFLK
jgi:DNA transformation protein